MNQLLMNQVEFFDTSTNKLQEHVNYDITATQNGQVVVSDIDAHSMTGIAEHITNFLESDEPIDIKVKIQGIGKSLPFSGPQGDVIEFTVIPEFENIAMLVLGVATAAIIGFTLKTRIISKPINA